MMVQYRKRTVGAIYMIACGGLATALSASNAAAACTFTWNTGCGGLLGCGGVCCESDWDESGRWNSGKPVCNHSYPFLSTDDATVQRNNGSSEGDEQWLAISLLDVTIGNLTILTFPVPLAALDLRFESQDALNTLTVDDTITVDGVNGDVEWTIDDSAVVTAKEKIHVAGGGTTVTITVKGGAKLQTDWS